MDSEPSECEFDQVVRSLVGAIGVAGPAASSAAGAVRQPAAEVPVPEDEDEDDLFWSVRLLDLKGVARPPSFSGRQEEWAEWRFKFLSAMYLLGIGKYLRLAETVGRPITMTPEEVSPAVRKKSELLYAVLVAVCSGKALTLLKLVRENNGLEVWRLLADE